MNETQKKVLLSQIRFALEDRYLNKVAKAANVSAVTLYKINDGKTNIYPTTIRRLCNYLAIPIPKDETNS